MLLAFGSVLVGVRTIHSGPSRVASPVLNLAIQFAIAGVYGNFDCIRFRGDHLMMRTAT
jgi:hypothetical protein